MELRVNEVNAGDEIYIRTQFSDYRFRVIHPCQCKGFLSGGPLGEQQHEAFFAGTLLPANIDVGGLTLLETGRRAVFLIGGNGLQKLTTSIITEITLAETQGEAARFIYRMHELGSNGAVSVTDLRLIQNLVRQLHEQL